MRNRPRSCARSSAWATALNVPVIAEGVETEEERVFLMKEGCGEFQGYLVGRPMPIAAYAGLTDRPSPEPQRASGRTSQARPARRNARAIG